MSSKMVRIQFEISSTLAKEIEAFEAESEIGSHREFYANLISLWRWSANRVREGKMIAAIDPQRMKFNEITLPSLETIKYKAMAERELSIAGLSEPRLGGELTHNGGDLTPQHA